MSDNATEASEEKQQSSEEVSSIQTEPQQEIENDNNNAVGESPSGSNPPSPFHRSVSQMSQRPHSSQSQHSVQSSGQPESRHSSHSNRPGSHKSGISQSESGVSFVTMSASKKSKSRSKITLSESSHQVTFTVTVAAAVPAAKKRQYMTLVQDEDGDGNKKSKRVVSDPKPQAFYHMEYYLLPTDVDPNKTDITLFGIAAKIYPDKQDAKVMKTWTEDNKTWIAWAHSHVINVTSDLLKKLCYHKLVLRIWDTRDKFAAKAKFDRPRAFKFPPPKPGEDLDDISGVKTLISRQSKAFLKKIPKHSHERILPNPTLVDAKSKGKTSATPEEQSAPSSAGTKSPEKRDYLSHVTDEVPCLLLGHPDLDYKIYSRLYELAQLEHQKIDHKIIRRNLDLTKPPTPRDSVRPQSTEEARTPQDPFGNLSKRKRGGGRSPSPSSRGRRPRNKKAEQLQKEATEFAKKHGVCSIHLPIGPLFVGQRTIVARLETPVKTVLDAFVSVSIDKDLLNESQKKELNPTSIHLKSVKNLPSDPVDYAQLQNRCHPCSLLYQFFKHEVHKTKGRQQSKDIHWDDLNVVLLGLIPKVELCEYLLGPPMTVQVHDRDTIPTEDHLNPVLFGNDLEDEKISNVGYISGRRTQYNALKGRPTSWDPYGEAKVNMADLLLGQKIINLQIPVHNCPMPDLLGRQDDKGKVVGVPGSVDGPSAAPMPPGKYIHSHTMLKVRIEVAVPLVTPEEVASKPDIPHSQQCAFGRIIYVLDNDQRSVAKDILDMITDINAVGLGLANLSPMVLDAALSTYKLSVEQQMSHTLDIITGFQVMDGKHHIFILEGIRDKAVARMWNSLSKPAPGVAVLYNSDMTFSTRLYGALDVDLTRVKLHESLPNIVRQPLLYVRDMVPKSCFISLTKLDELTRCNSIRGAVRTQLFPSSDQVIAMSREFGVPLTTADLITDAEKLAADEAMADKEELRKTKSALPAVTIIKSSRQQLKDLLDNTNPAYMQALQSRQNTVDNRNYVSDNIRVVELQSRGNKQRKMARPSTHASVKISHNYSTQTYNSTALAHENIKRSLDKDTLYSYNTQYHHSHTYVPVDLKKKAAADAKTHRDKFVANDDWTYPGVNTTQQCNEHSNKPDESRIADLNKEWLENLNHSNKLEPTLDREVYSWMDRHLDMNTWQYPAKHFEPGGEAPISIMLAGQKLKDEKMHHQREAKDKWYARMVTEDPRMHFHRLNPQTEQINRGLKASNDISKLEQLLKDPPKKHAFALPRMRTEIPPLRVVHYPGVDVKARSAGMNVDKLTAQNMQGEITSGFKPGPHQTRSWSLDSNRVPAVEYKIAEEGYFNVYHNADHEAVVAKCSIKPLDDKDYDSHLFIDRADVEYLNGMKQSSSTVPRQLDIVM